MRLGDGAQMFVRGREKFTPTLQLMKDAYL